MIVACGDNENIRKINFDKKVIFYGFDDANEYVGDNVYCDIFGFFIIVTKNITIFIITIKIKKCHMICKKSSRIRKVRNFYCSFSPLFKDSIYFLC